MKKFSMSRYQTMASFVSLLLAVVSAIFTCQLLITFGNTGIQKVIYVVFGVGIQATQTICFAIGCYLYVTGHGRKALPGFALWLLLFVLSITGTIGFFTVGNKQHIESTSKNSSTLSELDSEVARRKEMTAQEIKAIDSQIAELQKQAEGFQKRMIMTKGYIPAMQRIDDLSKRKDALIADLNGYSDKAISTKQTFVELPASEELYTSLAGFFGCQASEIKLFLYVAYGIALDLSTALLLAYSFGMIGKETAVYDGEPVRIRNNNLPESQSEITSGDKDINELRRILEQIERAGAAAAMNQAVKDIKTPIIPVVSADEPVFSGMPEESVNPVQYSTVQAEEHETDFRPGSEIAKGKAVAYIFDLFTTGREHLKGRRQIADTIGINQNEADTIHAYLKKEGLLKVDGMKSFPLKSRDEMVAHVMRDGFMM